MSQLTQNDQSKVLERRHNVCVCHMPIYHFSHKIRNFNSYGFQLSNAFRVK